MNANRQWKYSSKKQYLNIRRLFENIVFLANKRVKKITLYKQHLQQLFKMKIFITFLFLFAFSSTFAQIKKGDILIGGALNWSKGKSLNKITDRRFGINPELGFVLFNGFVLGGNVGYSYLKGKRIQEELYKAHDFLLGLKSSYFFGKEQQKLQPFISLSINYHRGVIHQRLILSANKRNETRFNWSGAIGLAYFVREHLGIKAAITYNWATFEGKDEAMLLSDLTHSSLLFRIGAFTYF